MVKNTAFNEMCRQVWDKAHKQGQTVVGPFADYPAAYRFQQKMYYYRARSDEWGGDEGPYNGLRITMEPKPPGRKSGPAPGPYFVTVSRGSTGFEGAKLDGEEELRLPLFPELTDPYEEHEKVVLRYVKAKGSMYENQLRAELVKVIPTNLIDMVVEQMVSDQRLKPIGQEMSPFRKFVLGKALTGL